MPTETSISFRAQDLRFEHRLANDALGVGESRPRISWRVSGAPAGFTQKRYQLEFFNQKPEDSGKPSQSFDVESSESVLVPWPSENPLSSREGMFVRVRVWGEAVTDPSEWSEPAYVEVGLLDRNDWQCQGISASWEQDTTAPRPEELYRRVFSRNPAKKVCKARLYITAQGVYETEINGRRVGDQFLAPGWSAYDERLHYQVYDVLEYLSHGETEDCIGIRVGEGWFCGRIGFEGGGRNLCGDRTAVMAQLELLYEDGVTQILCTDDSWEVASCPTRLAEIYHGEKYDATMEVPGWSSVCPSQERKSSGWSRAVVMSPLPAKPELLAMSGSPIRRLLVLQPKELITTPNGKKVLDFGQNLVGYTRINNVNGPRGKTIRLLHAEVMENGELGRRPLREADAEDEYRLKGSPEGESWEPRFTYHGFRYLQIEGLSPDTDLFAHFEAVVCWTEMEPTGEFSCSDSMLNKLHENVRWGMRGNFVGLPTDCPQRDERLGWTGDIALFAPTACFLYNCAGMLKTWLADLAVSQEYLGGVLSIVVPNVLRYNKSAFPKVAPFAIWADVTILAPWAIYQSTADVGILDVQYSSMQSWLASCPRDTKGCRRLYDASFFQLGDWLDPDAPPEKPQNAKTDAQLVANAFLIHSLDIISQISSILGKDQEARQYAAEASLIRQEFCNEYMTLNGRLVSDTQTAYALGICFDIFPTPRQRVQAGERLTYIVRKNEFRIGTGFAGTPFVCEALVLTGHTQIAYRMLLEDKCPSWLHPVTMGATTMWERWDSMLPDGSINPGSMTSFNHYALGAVATFMHERLAGLRCIEPGWKKARVEPIVGGDFTEATVSHVTPYGKVGCLWKIVDKRFDMTVLVPPNTSMEVVLPSGGDGAGEEVRTVMSGVHSFSVIYEKNYEWPPESLGLLG
ncbi:bacterial alpha-L-rhamnosidase domain-containing protein [Mollisia scopiformis]|uniref:alpha-L-rhamnosidase n=1 Tax=Mollisia scopiformis TaxID=149040 RepID=A0A194WZX6_MOLSC|nr:bacterial alpha-L-rhamnosidase domain-containing protein [Mollisia scopiformis]KUJ13501.1 bacterial alpha-L-rhamnosidase domain-containing protein [Mollisia scopiformis]